MNEKLIDSADIAAMLGMNRAYCVGRILKRPDFPKPAINITQKTRRWRLSDIQRWATRAKPPRPPQTRGNTPQATDASPDGR